MRKLWGVTGAAACVLAGWTAPVSADAVTEWNALAVGCINRPGATSLLDLALVQAAVHDAIQAIEHKYEPYAYNPASATGNASKAAAAAAAAYRVLSVHVHSPGRGITICPDASQAGLAQAFKPYLEGNDPGLAIGNAAGDALLDRYRPIPTANPPPTPTPYTGSTEIGQWRSTPPTNAPMAFVYLATATPFTMMSPSQFRPRPPPSLKSQTYLREYNEVKAKGNTNNHPATGACPAPAETDMARFWAGNFVAQWNQAARDIALDRQLSLGDTARLLALLGLAAADSGIAVWDSKLHFNYWRPITAIQLGDSDPNAATVGDAGWKPFIENTNHFPPPPTGAPSQTPPYPDYVSGANGLTGAYVAMLQLYFGTDSVPFEVYKASPATVAICRNPRTYRRLSDAAQEVVEARIWLGIHFRSADEEARRLGARVAWWTFAKALRPVSRHH